MARRVKERLSESARLEHVRAPPRRRRTPALPARTAATRRRLRLPHGLEQRPGVRTRPDRRRPSGSGRRSIRLTPPPKSSTTRSPLTSRRSVGRACGCALFGPDATIVGNAFSENPARVDRLVDRPRDLAFRAAFADQLRRPRAISASAAAARRSASDFARILNHPRDATTRSDRDPTDGWHAPPATAADPATVTCSASKPTRPPAISPSASRSVASYRASPAERRTGPSSPALDQLPRDPDVPAIDDQLACGRPDAAADRPSRESHTDR